MKYRVKWLPDAKHNLDEARKYLEQFTPPAYKRIFGKIKNNIELVRVHPYMYEAYKRRGKYRRMVVEDYIVFYRVLELEREIEVVRILHCAMDIDMQFLE